MVKPTLYILSPRQHEDPRKTFNGKVAMFVFIA